MRVRLEDVCCKASSNLRQKDIDEISGEFPVYGASGLVGKMNSYHQGNAYVAVVKDGAGIGRTTLLPGKTSVIGTMQYLLPKDNVLPQYLYYVVMHMHLEKYFTGATIPHIYFKDYKDEEFNLSDVTEQHEIVEILGRVEDIIQKRKDELEELDTLIKARFVEMFGDPVSNPMGWETVNLAELGSLKNGMNFHTADSGVDIRCLGVGDFKDRSVLTDISELTLISLNELPSADYLLQNGDIVFVRSNGNKALVGRSIAVYPGDIPATFSGFCIRFRCTSSYVRTEYLLRIFKADSVRKQMTGRGANIQNLNQGMLLALKVPIAPMDLQDAFAAFVSEVDKSKFYNEFYAAFWRQFDNKRQEWMICQTLSS